MTIRSHGTRNMSCGSTKKKIEPFLPWYFSIFRCSSTKPLTSSTSRAAIKFSIISVQTTKTLWARSAVPNIQAPCSIRLTYGMSIDYLAMPGIARDTKQRGATLITVHDDSKVDIRQVPLSEIDNK